MTENNIKVSIIVPVYNVEKYLAQCLDSLINQTLKEIEIICINDGSKDNSTKILTAYAQKDVRIKIINQTNQGISAARNNGISVATGEYIGFVDSDDWVDIDFYEKLYSAGKKYDSDIVAGDFYREGKFLKSEKLKYRKEELFTKPAEKVAKAFIPRYNYVWNKIYRREALLNLNFPFPIGKFYEDMFWIIRVINNLKSFVTVPKTYYHYRKVKGSIVNQKSVKHQQDRFLAEKEMLNYMAKNEIPILIKYKYGRKEVVKIFGLKVLKIEYYYPNIKKYKLFGFITIAEIISNQALLIQKEDDYGNS